MPIVDPSKVYVQSISYAGSGTPMGSVSHALSADRTALTLIFDKFVVSQGPGIPITEGRKNGLLNLTLAVPSGWSYTIATADLRGRAQLAAGMTGELKGISYFQGEVLQCAWGAQLVGPVAKDYLVRDIISLASLVWSPANKVVPINLNLQARLSGTGSGTLANDSVDGKLKIILGLQWRQC